MKFGKLMFGIGFVMVAVGIIGVIISIAGSGNETVEVNCYDEHNNKIKELKCEKRASTDQELFGATIAMLGGLVIFISFFVIVIEAET